MFLQVLNGSPSSAQWVPNVPDVFPKGVPNRSLVMLPLLMYVPSDPVYFAVKEDGMIKRVKEVVGVLGKDSA
jgi:hypothetical protein